MTYLIIALGKYEEIEPRYRNAVEIAEATPGKHLPSCSSELNYLAVVLKI